MLHCRGGYLYVGHTDDLDRRIAQHQSGAIPGFTADHLPVELVWSEEFQTREDAKHAEKMLKGWSRTKKLALVRGDWDRISALAKAKGSPSTSSGWAESGIAVAPKPARPEPVEASPDQILQTASRRGLHFTLLPHPDTPPLAVTRIEAIVLGIDANWLKLRWIIAGGSSVIVPPLAGRGRADGLWQATCFELFVRMTGKGAYCEFNLSPSERWAAYDFADYRDGMVERPMPRDPGCVWRGSQGTRMFDANLPFVGLPSLPAAIALSAVIEETDGTKSYWALAHPPGKPDFHHPTCFAATLPAPQRP